MEYLIGFYILGLFAISAILWAVSVVLWAVWRIYDDNLGDNKKWRKTQR